MKTRESCPPATESSDSMLPTFPSAASLAALRAWYEGLPARAAVARYLSDVKAEGESARSILSRIRRQLTAFARSRQQYDVAALFLLPITRQRQQADAVADAIKLLTSLPLPRPHIGDDIRHWFQPRSVAALRVYGIATLADLTVRIPRRRRWWVAIPGLGHAGARRIEAFFAVHPELTERARALAVATPQTIVVRWELLRLPEEIDGSRKSFRAPQKTCTLNSTNDYEAVQAWLSLHEATATQRAYRKEAERLILWAIVERKWAP